MHYYYYCYYYNHPGSSDGLLVLCLCLSVCFCVFLCSRVNDTMFKCLEPASVKRLVYLIQNVDLCVHNAGNVHIDGLGHKPFKSGQENFTER